MDSDIVRIREALPYIDPTDRETWVKAAMAVKSEVGEAGFALWDEWSQGVGSYSATDARDVWRSCKVNGKTTIGTLFHLAKQGGWRANGASPAPNPEELEARRQEAETRAAEERAKTERKRAEAASKAAAIWAAASPADGNPYLARKSVAPAETLRQIQATDAAKILGYVPKSGGEPLAGLLLVAPIKGGGRVSTLELIDGEGRKAALAGGAKKGGFWASGAMPDGDGTGATVLIGEGVATALSAREATGRPVVAALSSGNLVTVAKAMRDRYPAATLIVLADLVKATGKPDPHAVEAAQAVGGLLAVPDFGPDRRPDQTDINDLHQAIGLAAVAQSIASARAERGHTADPCRFAFSTVEALLATPPPAWRVAEVLPDLGIGVVWGGPGSGKTFVLLDLCLAVARGIPWHGRRVKACAVAYVATEGSLRNRLAAYLRQHDLAPSKLSRFRVLEKSVDLLSPRGDLDDLDDLLSAVRDTQSDAGRVGIVVIDTLNRAMPGGNENAPEDMGTMVAAAQYLAKELGCLVLYVHHSGKDETRGGRGHSSLKGAVDVELSVRRDGDIRTLAVEKLRDGRDGEAVLSFQLAAVDLGPVPAHDPDAGPHERIVSCVVTPCEAPLPPGRAKARGAAQRAVLSALTDCGPLTRVELRDKVTAYGHAKSAAYAAIRSLVESGDITAGSDSRYKLTDPGDAESPKVQNGPKLDNFGPSRDRSKKSIPSTHSIECGRNGLDGRPANSTLEQCSRKTGLFATDLPPAMLAPEDQGQNDDDGEDVGGPLHTVEVEL